MPVAPLPGLPLHYQDVGEGPALVLLHGFPFSSDLFRPQMEDLRSEFRVIAPDLPGFGKTPPAGEPSTMENLAERMLQLLDHLKLDRVALGGVSMGGYVAMALLRQDAGRISALALMDTQATADDAAGKARREETAKSVEAEGLTFLTRTMLPQLFASATSEKIRQEVEGMMRAASQEGAAAASRGMGLRPDSREILARYGGPTLIVVGEEDQMTPPAKSQQMAELVSGSKLVKVANAGHLANLENHQPVNQALRSLTGRRSG